MTPNHMSKTRVKAYRKVCNSTQQGVFVNIVERGKSAKQVLDNIEHTMITYKKDVYPIITERGDSALHN
jgi:hypothetical protein